MSALRVQDWRKYWLIALDCINQLRPLAQLQAGPQQTALKQRRAAEQLMKTVSEEMAAVIQAARTRRTPRKKSSVCRSLSRRPHPLAWRC